MSPGNYCTALLPPQRNIQRKSGVALSFKAAPSAMDKAFHPAPEHCWYPFGAQWFHVSEAPSPKSNCAVFIPLKLSLSVAAKSSSLPPSPSLLFLSHSLFPHAGLFRWKSLGHNCPASSLCAECRHTVQLVQIPPWTANAQRTTRGSLEQLSSKVRTQREQTITDSGQESKFKG